MKKRNWKEFNDFDSKTESQITNGISDQSKPLVRVHSTRSGKAGKTVTLISGLGLDHPNARQLLKTLKAQCGTGGTVKGDLLELQGNQVDLVISLLKERGYFVQKFGA